jgi:hypothetical protein
MNYIDLENKMLVVEEENRILTGLVVKHSSRINFAELWGTRVMLTLGALVGSIAEKDEEGFNACLAEFARLDAAMPSFFEGRYEELYEEALKDVSVH